jgi:hypothetical protein
MSMAAALARLRLHTAPPPLRGRLRVNVQRVGGVARSDRPRVARKVALPGGPPHAAAFEERGVETHVGRGAVCLAVGEHCGAGPRGGDMTSPTRE